VDEDIPGTSNVPPRDLRVLRPKLVRKLLHRFADDLDPTRYRILLLDVLSNASNVISRV